MNAHIWKRIKGRATKKDRKRSNLKGVKKGEATLVAIKDP